MESYENLYESVHEFQRLMGRLITFPMPTLAVMNGSAIAGGYFLSICHDFRIQNEVTGTICLSELKLGFPIPPAYFKVLYAKLAPSLVTKMGLAVTIKPADALA